MLEALRGGYESAVDDPDGALETLSPRCPGSSEESQRAQLDALLEARAFEPPITLDPASVSRWDGWARGTGILEGPLEVDEAFEAQPLSSRSTSSGSSRAMRERGTTTSKPAASAARRVSTSTCE